MSRKPTAVLILGALLAFNATAYSQENKSQTEYSSWATFVEAIRPWVGAQWDPKKVNDRFAGIQLVLQGKFIGLDTKGKNPIVTLEMSPEEVTVSSGAKVTLKSLVLTPEPKNIEAWKSAIPDSTVRFRTTLKPSETLPVLYPMQVRLGGSISHFITINTFDAELIK